MTTLIRTLLNWYIYIASYLCPQYLSGFKDNYNISPFSSYDDIELLNNKNTDNDNDNDENNDENKNIYNKNYKQFMDCDDYVSYEPIKKTKSTTLPLYYCGWCGLNINGLTHAYMDNVYCSVSCRNYQISKDKPHTSQEHKRRMTMSFSL